MATSLPSLPEVESLSPAVIRILGGNPGKFTLQGTNTYIVGTGRDRILVDTGEGLPRWLDLLRTTLTTHGAEISHCILTHWHHDHVGGVADLASLGGDLQIWKFPLAGEDVRADSPMRFVRNLEEGHICKVEGATVKAVHTPGHTRDHAVLILEEENACFTGDSVLGHGTAVFENYEEYVASLTVTEGLFTGRAYPGHGAVIEDGPGKVREYIEHRREREGDILDVLRSGDVKGKTPTEVVQIVYAKYPENLHTPAERGVRLVLMKLKGEGRVMESGDRWHIDEQRIG